MFVSKRAISPTENGLAISVWVVPGASRSVIDGLYGGHVKIRVAAPPEGGRANEEAARLLGDTLRTDVTLKKGMRGRAKVFEVSCTDIEAVREKLGL